MVVVAIFSNLSYALGPPYSLPLLLSSLLRPPPLCGVGISIGVGGVGSVGDNGGGGASVHILFCVSFTLSRVALAHVESRTVAFFKSDCIESNAPEHTGICMRVTASLCVSM